MSATASSLGSSHSTVPDPGNAGIRWNILGIAFGPGDIAIRNQSVNQLPRPLIPTPPPLISPSLTSGNETTQCREWRFGTRRRPRADVQVGGVRRTARCLPTCVALKSWDSRSEGLGRPPRSPKTSLHDPAGSLSHGRNNLDRCNVPQLSSP